MNSTGGLMLVGLVLAACAAKPADDNGQAAFTDQVENAVRHSLRDPDSAQFSDVTVNPAQKVGTGKVNAKNGFGGYAGDDSFIYADGDVAFTSDLDAHYKLVNAKFEAGMKQASIASLRAALVVYKSLPASAKNDRDIASTNAELSQLGQK